MNIIGKGEYGIVYEVIHNNTNMVAKVFNSNKDYKRELEIYTKILPILCGKIIINNVISFYIFDNKKYRLNDYTNNNNIITITDKLILDNINKVIQNDFEDFISIKINLTNNIINGDTQLYNHNIGRIIIEDKKYLLYIDSFKFIRLLDYTHKTLYFQNLGINLTKFLEYNKPELNQRIYMCIDLIRQISELIDRGIYHNDIKCENLLVKLVNNNYYINIIDFGICVANNDIELKEQLLTTCNAYSPEYFTLYNKYNLGIKNINILKDILDYSSHWIIAGIIIDIIVWKNIQYSIWLKHYHTHDNINSLKRYSNISINYNYIIDLLFTFAQCDDIYIDVKYKEINNNNIAKLIEDYYDENDLFNTLFNTLKINIAYYKTELIPLITNLFSMLEYETNKKKLLNKIYSEISIYNGYKDYLLSKLLFI